MEGFWTRRVDETFEVRGFQGVAVLVFVGEDEEVDLSKLGLLNVIL